MDLLDERSPIYFANTETWANALKVVLYFHAEGHGMKKVEFDNKNLNSCKSLYCFKKM